MKMPLERAEIFGGNTFIARPYSIAGLPESYQGLLSGVTQLLEAARRSAGRAVNFLMTATCWDVGRHIVDQKQGGAVRAGYGAGLLTWLSVDLTAQFGRGLAACLHDQPDR